MNSRLAITRVQQLLTQPWPSLHPSPPQNILKQTSGVIQFHSSFTDLNIFLYWVFVCLFAQLLR